MGEPKAEKPKFSISTDLSESVSESKKFKKCFATGLDSGEHTRTNRRACIPKIAITTILQIWSSERCHICRIVVVAIFGMQACSLALVCSQESRHVPKHFLNFLDRFYAVTILSDSEISSFFNGSGG